MAVMTQERRTEVLEAIVRLAVTSESVRLVPCNEFHRKMVARAQELGVTVEELESVVVPILRGSFEAMLATKKETSKARVPSLPVPGGPFAPKTSQ